MEKLQVTITIDSTDFVELMIDYLGRLELVAVATAEGAAPKPERKSRTVLSPEGVEEIHTYITTKGKGRDKPSVMRRFKISAATYDRIRNGTHVHQQSGEA